MMIVITHVVLKEGMEPEWDAAMRDRLGAAREEDGWIGVQLSIPLDDMRARTIVGTWRSRGDWERWHLNQAFEETRRRLADLEAKPQETRWYECTLDLRRNDGEPRDA